jgi:hypothetical protein
MFNSHLTIVTNAMKEEDKINKKYTLEKERISLKFKNLVKDELKKFDEITLKDYSIIKHQNSISEIIIEEKNIDEHFKKDLKYIEDILEKELNIVSIREMYKIIPSNENNYFCKVYFTLVKTDLCNKGDVFKIEWIQINQTHIIAAASIITKDGINIPQFSKNRYLTSHTNFYPIKHWGENSNQERWWLEWVKNNRPI